MQNHLDIRTILSVYEKVKTQGQKTEKGCQLGEIVCSESYDGYCVSLADINNTVSLDVNFHNTYHFHTQHDDIDELEKKTTFSLHNDNEVQIQAFVKKLVALDEAY